MELIQVALDNAFRVGYIGFAVACVVHGLAQRVLDLLSDEAQERAKQAGFIALVVSAIIAIVFSILFHPSAEAGIAVIMGAIAACAVIPGMVITIAALLLFRFPRSLA